MREKKKNKMRSPTEKERIVLESYKIGRSAIIEKYEISDSMVTYWRRKYEEHGIFKKSVPPPMVRYKSFVTNSLKF